MPRGRPRSKPSAVIFRPRTSSAGWNTASVRSSSSSGTYRGAFKICNMVWLADAIAAGGNRPDRAMRRGVGGGDGLDVTAKAERQGQSISRPWTGAEVRGRLTYQDRCSCASWCRRRRGKAIVGARPRAISSPRLPVSCIASPIPRCSAVSSGLDLLALPSVRVVLGHWLFGYIHPYPDGNGRMARFMMNAILASGGYPWTVIRMEDRDGYLSALESASIDLDIRPFAGFVAERVEWSMEQAA